MPRARRGIYAADKPSWNEKIEMKFNEYGSIYVYNLW